MGHLLMGCLISNLLTFQSSGGLQIFSFLPVFVLSFAMWLLFWHIWQQNTVSDYFRLFGQMCPCCCMIWGGRLEIILIKKLLSLISSTWITSAVCFFAYSISPFYFCIIDFVHRKTLKSFLHDYFPTHPSFLCCHFLYLYGLYIDY